MEVLAAYHKNRNKNSLWTKRCHHASNPICNGSDNLNGFNILRAATFVVSNAVRNIILPGIVPVITVAKPLYNPGIPSVFSRPLIMSRLFNRKTILRNGRSTKRMNQSHTIKGEFKIGGGLEDEGSNGDVLAQLGQSGENGRGPDRGTRGGRRGWSRP